MTGVAITRDGRRLYTSSEDAKVRVWELPSQRLLHTLDGEMSAYNSVALSPDETRLTDGRAHGRINLWDLTLDPPQQLASLSRHKNAVTELAFSPDGATLLSRSADGLHLWRASPTTGNASSTNSTNTNGISP